MRRIRSRPAAEGPRRCLGAAAHSPACSKASRRASSSRCGSRPGPHDRRPRSQRRCHAPSPAGRKACCTHRPRRRRHARQHSHASHRRDCAQRRRCNPKRRLSARRSSRPFRRAPPSCRKLHRPVPNRRPAPPRQPRRRRQGHSAGRGASSGRAGRHPRGSRRCSSPPHRPEADGAHPDGSSRRRSWREPPRRCPHRRAAPASAEPP
mmetsp:Transcript_16044/g.44753  ORF Transcript_16044/g.44753 Transcript_16044/m.44753 type:complete len:207 (-) Transcript_16044:156-776(-)